MTIKISPILKYISLNILSDNSWKQHSFDEDGLYPDQTDYSSTCSSDCSDDLSLGEQGMSITQMISAEVSHRPFALSRYLLWTPKKLTTITQDFGIFRRSWRNSSNHNPGQFESYIAVSTATNKR